LEVRTRKFGWNEWFSGSQTHAQIVETYTQVGLHFGIDGVGETK